MEVPNNGVSFLNTDDQAGEEPNTALTTNREQKKTYKRKNVDKSKVTCHRCGKKGHYYVTLLSLIELIGGPDPRVWSTVCMYW
jgi:hypothetical protein